MIRKGIFYLIIVGLLLGFVGYNWLLFASEWSETVLRITVVIFVLALLIIIGTIFGAMASSYPASKSLE